MNFYKELGLKLKKETSINAENKFLVEKAVSLGHGELSKNGSLFNFLFYFSSPFRFPWDLNRSVQ